ncbi:MAG: dihydroneopterin aldolase family protein [Conexivisphaerales archaeon]
MSDPASKYFDPSITDRERAIFEAAIALAMIYHKFTGIPISSDKRLISSLEETIRLSSATQPFKESTDVKIKTGILKKKKNPYDYTELSGRNIDVKVVARYGGAEATARLRFIREINYPLMYIEKVKSRHNVKG